MNIEPGHTLSPPAELAQEHGLIIGSDMTVDSARYFYVRDHGRFKTETGEWELLGEDGIRRVIKHAYGCDVLKIRALCVANEYAITARGKQ